MTWHPPAEIIAAALAHAAACAPMECCGVVIADRFHPVTNTADDAMAFVMDRREYCDLENEFGPVAAIVHSHVFAPPLPSQGDKAMAEKLGVPWLIVSHPTGAWQVFEPCGFKAPLIGRQWAWGTHDCYGIIRDGMAEFAGIAIPDFQREWLWWERGGDIIREQFAEAGFVPVDDEFRHCDVIGMQFKADVVNHLGLFLAPNLMLHHIMHRLSARDVYGGLWSKMTVLHLRHRDLMGAPYG
jgi:proteasome lid subunit RPN8/RPN11